MTDSAGQPTPVVTEPKKFGTKEGFVLPPAHPHKFLRGLEKSVMQNIFIIIFLSGIDKYL
jgi:hypothetical protein